ncbi:MAG: hypothetical protein JWN84_3261, partial [Nocardioides sp.]|nr:hypothetical protein [Nocardioides sp.]
PVVPGPAVPDVPAAQPADLPAVVTTATDAPQPTEAPVVGPVAPTGSTTSGPDADAQDAPPSPRPLETLAAPITAPVTTTNQTGPTAPVAPAAPTAPTVTPEVRAATQHVVDEVVRLTEASASAPRQLVLRLDPGSLGEVHVRLRVHAGVVRVHLSAGDAAVREALASDVGRLHTLLGTRLDDVRVVVQDLPRVVQPALPTTPTAPERAGQPLTGGHHEPSGGHGSGHQPGHAPEHGRPTRTSDVTPATDGTHRWVPRPATADPLAAGPHRLDVSV